MTTKCDPLRNRLDRISPSCSKPLFESLSPGSHSLYSFSIRNHREALWRCHQGQRIAFDMGWPWHQYFDRSDRLASALLEAQGPSPASRSKIMRFPPASTLVPSHYDPERDRIWQYLRDHTRAEGRIPSPPASHTVCRHGQPTRRSVDRSTRPSCSFLSR